MPRRKQGLTGGDPTHESDVDSSHPSEEAGDVDRPNDRIEQDDLDRPPGIDSESRSEPWGEEYEVESSADEQTPIDEWIDSNPPPPVSLIVSSPGGSPGGWNMGQTIGDGAVQPPRIIVSGGAPTITTTTSSDPGGRLDPNNNSGPAAPPGGAARFSDLSDVVSVEESPDWRPISADQAKANGRRLREEFRGHLDYAFSQAKEMSRPLVRLRFGRSEGICLTMSLDWLARMHHGRRDYGDPHYARPVNRVTFLWKLAGMHELYRKQNSPGRQSTQTLIGWIAGHKDARPEMARLQASQAFLSYGERSSPRRIALALQTALEHPDHPGMLLRLSGGVQGAAHAVAIFRRHDGYVVFDPNFGAYRFDDGEQATRFFVRLWDEIYRARSGMGWIQGDWVDMREPD
ncbi:YopT-type cysteine protease domain-containing protein [Nannocystis sp. RBIL2]|uniref:YopT-type cysteine protease domain-containing protein n=1 Tax=Nannocystis sp. RBIL2 TaxID=2996788 RepID=UPI00227075FC|nr:YopT-type cysteine protease domain-containing protein [Nannocystis sp. RBIL2]